MFKKCKIVVLTTNDKVKLFRDNSKNELFYSNLTPQTGNSINSCVDGLHLYILSDDEMNQGDPIIEDINETLILQYHSPHSMNENIYRLGKIIASTNTSLNLPKPSNAFLKKYCQLGGLNNIMVEYENDWVYCDNVYNEYNEYPISKSCPECGGTRHNALGGCATKLNNGIKPKINKSNKISIRSI